MSIKVFLTVFGLLFLLVIIGQAGMLLSNAHNNRAFCFDPAAYAADLWRMSLDFLIEGRAEQRRLFQSIADRAAAEHNLDPALFRSLVNNESGWEATAVSSSGAVGLAQLMPATAEEECGLSRHQLTNPTENLNCGAHYLSKQIKRFGSVEKALCAYNAGPSITARLGRCPNYGETRRYVKRVMRGWHG